MILLLPIAAAPPSRPTTPPRGDTAPVVRFEEQAWVSATDLARLLDGTIFWRSDLKKLVVRTRVHRFTFTIDNPFVIVDQRTIRLGSPVRARAGEILVPLAFVDSLPRDSTLARLALDSRREQIARLGGAPLAVVPATPPDTARGGPAAGPPPAGGRTIVLDPGHGGADVGVGSAPLREKDLALALARLVAGDLERRAGFQVVLTRGDDRAVAAETRAEIANRARAALVVSLHFDGFAGTTHRGATAWCPPASALADGARPDDRTAPVPMLAWRDVALRHAGASRACAASLVARLQAEGLGPARVRERLPCALVGVDAPGLVLECATLTAGADRARLAQGDGLPRLARAIAEGVATWSRSR